MKTPGYISIMMGGGWSLLDPNKVSNVRQVGEQLEEGTGLTLIVHEYDYNYGDEIITHKVYVPADRAFTFADEIKQALADREQPDWVDVLHPSKSPA